CLLPDTPCRGSIPRTLAGREGAQAVTPSAWVMKCAPLVGDERAQSACRKRRAGRQTRTLAV
ncbi:hypothetical protein, partial [Mycolicibacterium conceptionense]|uniref:hypothetical protein n=1 Tax=Mycolicibacterium conceptionense TaxID=451644 RepID=UPI001C2C9B0E